MGVVFLPFPPTLPRVAMKLIFLDVDGVLNRETTEDKFEEDCLVFLREIVKATEARIVLSSTWRYTEETRNSLREQLRKSDILGEDEDFLGYTAHLGLLDAIPRFPSPHSHATRTDEILLWIKCNTVPMGCSASELDAMNAAESSYHPFVPEVASFKDVREKGEEWSTVGSWLLDTPVEVSTFVVLDDLPMLQEGCYGGMLRRNFVHTSMETGLTPKDVEQAIKILSSNRLRFNFKRWRKLAFRSCPNPECLLLTDDDEEEREARRRAQNRGMCRPF